MRQSAVLVHSVHGVTRRVSTPMRVRRFGPYSCISGKYWSIQSEILIISFQYDLFCRTTPKTCYGYAMKQERIQALIPDLLHQGQNLDLLENVDQDPLCNMWQQDDAPGCPSLGIFVHQNEYEKAEIPCRTRPCWTTACGTTPRA